MSKMSKMSKATPNRASRIVKGTFSILFVLTVLTLSWIIVFYVAGWLKTRLDWNPGELMQQVVVSIGGFFLFELVMMSLGPLFRRKETLFYSEMLAALKLMSQGNFNVHLAYKARPEHPILGELMDNINEMAQNLREMENLRQDFIANVSHEIQTPLTSIRGFAKAMLDEELSRRQQLQYLDIIHAESQRLSRLSDDLLSLASLDADKQPFQPTNYRLDKQLQHIILTLEPLWLEKKQDVGAQLNAVYIEADKSLLNQVWLNLLNNALKFTPPNGTITVDCSETEDQILVKITDNGIGLSAENRLRIFERFYKADQARSTSTGGSGLGLSIVNEIVRMHRGTIEVESELGKGTTVAVALPKVHPA